ncbi:MAG: phasin family protein, partial [Pseudomonadota bacterium]
MSSISEQISAVTKTTLANPLAVINAFSKTAFGSIEKIIALNMHAVKQSLESSTTATRELLSANKPQELFALSTAQAQPNIAKIVAYGRELADISAQTRNEFLSSLALSADVATVVVSHKSTKP